MNTHQLKQYLLNNLWFGENGTPRDRRINHMRDAGDFRARQAVANVIMPDPTRKWILDISHWNIPPVNLQRMKDLYGLAGVIIKGCDGSLRSRYFDEHRANAKAAGLPWGIYDWLYPGNRVNIDAQVNAWASQYNEDPPPLGVFKDAEWTTYAGQPANPTTTDLQSATTKLDAKINRKSITYTAKGYADTYLKGFDWSREPLWVANYGVASPTLPVGAQGYILWQFTSSLDGSQLDPNGNKELDGSYDNGLLGETTEPPTGGSMYKKATGNITMRTGPGTSYPNATIDGVSQYVLTNDILEVSEIQNGFAHIVHLWRADVLTEIPPDPVWCGTAYLQDTTYTPPESPATGSFEAVLTEKDASGNVTAVYKGTLTKQ